MIAMIITTLWESKFREIHHFRITSNLLKAHGSN